MCVCVRDLCLGRQALQPVYFRKHLSGLLDLIHGASGPIKPFKEQRDGELSARPPRPPPADKPASSPVLWSRWCINGQSSSPSDWTLSDQLVCKSASDRGYRAYITTLSQTEQGQSPAPLLMVSASAPSSFLLTPCTHTHHMHTPITEQPTV